MNLSGICYSEFNHKQDRKHIFLTPDPESLNKVKKHWGSYQPPIVNNRIIINTKKYVELDKPIELHLKIRKYTAFDEKGEKYSNFKLIY